VPLSRRDLLKRSAQIGLGIVVAGNTDLFTAVTAGAAPGGAKGPGKLLADPAGLLDLPPGFSYRVLSRADGAAPRPAAYDGTGAFAVGGSTFLIRNHEQSTGGVSCAVFDPKAPMYDPTVAGGTSTIELDRNGNVVAERISLAGTSTNCAGGVTPWGTWLTCEETEAPGHGYVFEVHPVLAGDPRPIKQLGRFKHEAAVVDPETGAVYLTEDASGPYGLVYRYVPSTKVSGFKQLLDTTGDLFAMGCTRFGAPVADLHGFSTIGTTLDVAWTKVTDPDATSVPTRKQLPDAKVTRSQKFDGAWWQDGKAFIVCSYSHSGAAQHDGQVWSYDPKRSTLTLEAYFARNTDPTGAGADLPDGPDNITVAPGGGLFLAEDGDGVNHLLAVSRDRRTTELFARNALNDSEFTGVVFSPDGRTMFANIQSPGITFAITGPFERMA
jgi:secreted PhoX family phosphatase